MDNLRWLVILVLFPYHTLIIYSGIASYYFHAANNIFANAFILTFAPWFMQLLFVIAGIATFYSLKKRNTTQYLRERVSKLLIPMVAGMILVIPVSVYFGFLYNGYTGGFLSLWVNIFTNPSYLGQGLLLGPLWFLLYLFIVSLVALPFILKYEKRNFPIEKYTIPKLLLLIFPLAIGSYFFNIYPEKSVLEFLLLFIFGYFLLSDDGVQEKLEKYRWHLFIPFVVLTAIYVSMTAGSIGSGGSATTTASLSVIISGFMIKLFTSLILWLGVLSIMGMGKHYLEFKNKTTLYLSAVSFPIYIFHIVWINMFAYYIISWIPGQMAAQVILIMALSFVFTIANIEVVRRIPGIRTLFGLKG
jgi:hypothetical protein